MPEQAMTRSIARLLVAALALAAVATAFAWFRASEAGLAIEPRTIEGTPATVFRLEGAAPGPAVVIAHGFAGSQQLMRPFARRLARAGYVAVTFDFAGHGRNPAPLFGSITRTDGATRTLVSEIGRVAAFARGVGDGRLAVLGHSMACDIIVRYSQADPMVAATIAISMFSPAVADDTPRNLLIIVGDWEPGLKREALRVTAAAAAPAPASAGVTYGDLAAGTGRRVVFAPMVEHVGVLYAQAGLDEAAAWLDATFARPPLPSAGDGGGLALMLLVAGVVALAWPVSTLLPRLADPPAGAGLGWRRLWIAVVAPMIITPLMLAIVPTRFLPILVGDYLAAHFFAYGLVTLAVLAAIDRGRALALIAIPDPRRFAIAALAASAFFFIGFAWPFDAQFTSFALIPARIMLVAALIVGTLSFFLAVEWATRGAGAARGAYALAKTAFLVSLAIAVVLDFQRLFFLLIIVPVILVFFLVFGLFSRWCDKATGDPRVGATASAIAFGWSVGVTFPMLGG